MDELFEEQQMNDATLPNEEAAEYRTNIEGWVCKTCRRYYGREGGAERAARYCCEKDHKCDADGCTNRSPKGRIYCAPCDKRRDEERYLKLPVVEWDGERPLVVYDDDRYFFDVDDLLQYLEEDDLKLEDVRLVLAEEDQKPSFEMSEFLSDYLCDDNRMDLELGTEKVDKYVNRWIEKYCPTTWVSSHERPSLESLKAHTTFEKSEADES